MKKLILLLLIAPSLSLAGWSGFGKVTDIYSHDGTILITTEIGDSSCENKGKFWWSTSDTDSEVLLSLALVSFTTGDSISVVYEPNTPECLYGFSKMTHLRINKPN